MLAIAPTLTPVAGDDALEQPAQHLAGPNSTNLLTPASAMYARFRASARLR